MAPEVLYGKEYGFSVDYWSLGTILFEFLAGYPPVSFHQSKVRRAV